jgi:hypothetical protein
MNKTHFNVSVKSSRIEQGIWIPAVYSPLHLLEVGRSDDIDDNFDYEDTLVRMEIDIPNMYECLNFNILKSLYQNFDKCPWVIRYIDECCITNCSILIVLN